MLDVRKEQTPSDPSGLEIPSTGICQRRSGDLLQVGAWSGLVRRKPGFSACA